MYRSGYSVSPPLRAVASARIASGSNPSLSCGHLLWKGPSLHLDDVLMTAEPGKYLDQFVSVMSRSNASS